MKCYFELTPSTLMNIIKAGQNMTTLEMMSKARLISHSSVTESDLQKIIFDNSEEETVLERRVSLEEDPRPVKKKQDPINKARSETVFTEVSDENAKKIQELLSHYLSNRKHNLTDNQVYQIYNMLSQIVNNSENIFNQKDLVEALDNYMIDNQDDIGSLSSNEINRIIQEVEEDEYDTQVFISNWPNQKPKNVFVEK